MTTAEILDYIRTAFVALGAITISFAALSYRASVRNNTANLFLSLRKYYMDIHTTLYQEIPDLEHHSPKGNYQNLSQQQKAAVQKYWINSFNEWYTTKIIHTNDGLRLWSNFYRRAQASSLINDLLREGLAEMFSSDSFSFGALEGKFRTEIIEIVLDIINGRLRFAIDRAGRDKLSSFKTALSNLPKG
jgi:hypothetical protein